MRKLILLLSSINFAVINLTQITSCSANKSSKTKGLKKDHEKNNEEDNEYNDADKNNDADNGDDNNVDNNDKENNFIVDLDDPNNIPINVSENWKWSLLNLKSIAYLIKKDNFPYKKITAEQWDWISKFTVAMHVKASEKSIQKFNNFLGQKRFETFDDLVNTIDNHNANSPENSYIDVPLRAIHKHTKFPVEFEETMLKIYNTLSYFLGKIMVIKF